MPAISALIPRPASRLSSRVGRVAALLPGVLLCGVVSGAGWLLQQLQMVLFGHAWMETLVLAIALGSVLRSAWLPGARWEPGIRFSAKPLLEFGVMLLGASVDLHRVLAAGPMLLLAIVLMVPVAIAVGWGIGRLFGLPHRIALLVACGNAICGNSAIAAVAPAIDAEAGEVAAAIAFTAVFGVVAVLLLPLLAHGVGWSPRAYGIFAGLTVYAVPQVLAATAPLGAVAVQTGALVKLLRVLMLGPVVALLSLLGQRGQPESARASGVALLPWFIVGFALLLLARAAGWLPPGLAQHLAALSGLLTVASMAALGLGVDLRAVLGAGARLTLAVSLSLLALGLLAWGVLSLLPA